MLVTSFVFFDSSLISNWDGIIILPIYQAYWCHVNGRILSYGMGGVL